MTLDEFFEQLPKDGWKVDDLGMIRRVVDYCEDCPITAVYNDINQLGEDDRFEADDAECTVAPMLGLNSMVAGNIIMAADERLSILAKCPYADDVLSLRRRLLEHCGLKETDDA